MTHCGRIEIDEGKQMKADWYGLILVDWYGLWRNYIIELGNEWWFTTQETETWEPKVSGKESMVFT